MITNKTQSELVEEIHNSFYNAGESALNEAKKLLALPKINVASIAERFNKLGFNNCKAVNDAKALEEKQNKAPELIAAIEYFKVYYPNNKFILEADAKTICEKYGLLLGEAKQYTGSIPEKNLCEIEQFKLREEDMQEKTEWSWDSLSLFDKYIPNSMFTSRIISPFMLDDYGQFKSERMYDYEMSTRMLYSSLFPKEKIKGTQKEPKKSKYKPEFKICAPKTDFNTLGYEVRDGYKLVYDPVVLQPVKHNGIEGYLIISAWGLEANDEIVVNQTMN